MNGTAEKTSRLHDAINDGWFRGRRRRRRSRIRCPYCLEDLTDLELTPPKHCFLCRHDIPASTWGVPLHCLNRPQQWDLLAGEMDYQWNAEHYDVLSYLDTMGEYFNPDYSDAKHRLLGMLIDKAAVLALAEEFIEAEGELDALVAGYLRKREGREPYLAFLLMKGSKWRQWAFGLSAEAAGPLLVAEYQLDYVRNLPWGAYIRPAVYGNVLKYLEERLEKLHHL